MQGVDLSGYHRPLQRSQSTAVGEYPIAARAALPRPVSNGFYGDAHQVRPHTSSSQLSGALTRLSLAASTADSFLDVRRGAGSEAAAAADTCRRWTNVIEWANID
jgi:hypothetical protein